MSREDVPNLYVSVALVRGSDACPRQVKEPDYRIGYCQLAVEDPQRRLAIEVQTGATNYLPAQPVTATIDIKDSQGRPANDAEVIVYAVDEGVLSLSSAETPRPLRVLLYLAASWACIPASLCRICCVKILRNCASETRDTSAAAAEMNPCAKTFLPVPSGRRTCARTRTAVSRFSSLLPMGLTSYRARWPWRTREPISSASSQASFKVSKPLVVEPALPLFANVTDRLQARAIVLNQTDRAGEVEVTLELDGRAKAAPALAGAESQSPDCRKGFCCRGIPGRVRRGTELPNGLGKPGLPMRVVLPTPSRAR